MTGKLSYSNLFEDRALTVIVHDALALVRDLGLPLEPALAAQVSSRPGVTSGVCPISIDPDDWESDIMGWKRPK